MKRFAFMILNVLLIIALFLASYATSLADNEVTRVQTMERGASLRDKPNGTKIGSIHANKELEVIDQQNGWFYVCYGNMTGWVSSDMVIILGTGNNTNTTISPYSNDKPVIGKYRYGLNTKNDAVRWVQDKLKETGIWYQGDEWKVTGNLGKHTMQEISRFMENRGYRGHSGMIDQTVVDELYAYLYGDAPQSDENQTVINDPTVPQIGNAVYGLNTKNDTIRWVQNKLKETGVWYQGDEWKVTGNLGKHTMQEIGRFMEFRGHVGHNGMVSQAVINELYMYLYGGQQVYTGD